MSRVIKCDSCGTIFVPSINKYDCNRIQFKSFDLNGSNKDIKTVDVCKDCMGIILNMFYCCIDLTNKED